MRRAVFVTAAIALAATARAEGPGTLSGSVRSADGLPLPQIVLRLEGPGGARSVVSGLEGRFRVEHLPVGDYRVSAATPGLALNSAPSISIGDSEARLELTLAPAPLREHVLVAATRGEAAASTLGVSTWVIERAEIEARDASSLLPLLQDVPGVAVARTGGVGLQGSAFVRGGDSRYARVLIDGVPVNQPGGNFDLGSAIPLELERIEVVRGAASSLYGTDALAGVIHLVSRQAGPHAGAGVEAEAEGGSFGWQRYRGATSGRSGGFDWNVGLQRLDTDNQQPNSAFRQTAGAAALGLRLDERSTLNLFARLEDGRAGTPGQVAFGRPDLEDRFERQDLTLGARFRHVRDGFAHEARVGFASTDQLTLDPADSGSYLPRFGALAGAFEFSDFPDPLGFQNDTRRLTLGYLAEWQAGARHLLTAGTDVERETGEIGSRAGELLSPERTNAGLYVQDRLVLGERVFVTLGGRVERNASFGWRAVPRAAVAARVHGGANATVLRASAGAGIKKPNFFESFGISFFAQGNPDLKPERSRTFDLGLEQRLASGRVRAEATFFHHAYLDQIAFRIVDFTTFQGSYVNLGEARARGLELALAAAPVPQLSLSAAYTFLDGEVLVSTSDFDPVYAVGQPLLRRPRHQASFAAQGEIGRVQLGATLAVVGRRGDSDFAGIGLTSNEGYTRFDARARVELGRGLQAFVVAENLLDRDYMEVLGYPANGRSVRAGLRLRTGGR